MEEKITEWINQLEVLSETAAAEPRAASCAFVGGFKYKVIYTTRTVSNIRRHLE